MANLILQTANGWLPIFHCGMGAKPLPLPTSLPCIASVGMPWHKCVALSAESASQSPQEFSPGVCLCGVLQWMRVQFCWIANASILFTVASSFFFTPCNPKKVAIICFYLFANAWKRMSEAYVLRIAPYSRSLWTASVYNSGQGLSGSKNAAFCFPF